MVLRDGHTVHVRPIVPGDADRLLRFHSRQSPESIYFRYFSPRPELSERDVQHFTVVDHVDRVAFIALSDDEIVGVARYERYRGTDTAEVAFFAYVFVLGRQAYHRGATGDLDSRYLEDRVATQA